MNLGLLLCVFIPGSKQSLATRGYAAADAALQCMHASGRATPTAATSQICRTEKASSSRRAAWQHANASSAQRCLSIIRKRVTLRYLTCWCGLYSLNLSSLVSRIISLPLRSPTYIPTLDEKTRRQLNQERLKGFASLGLGFAVVICFADAAWKPKTQPNLPHKPQVLSRPEEI